MLESPLMTSWYDPTLLESLVETVKTLFVIVNMDESAAVRAG